MYLMYWVLHLDYRALVCQLTYTWYINYASLWPRVPYGDTELDKHWLRFWLVAWWHQPITWISIDLPSIVSCVIHLRAISKKFYMHSLIVVLKLWTHLPGSTELIIWVLMIWLSSSKYVKHVVWLWPIMYSKLLYQIRPPTKDLNGGLFS